MKIKFRKSGKWKIHGRKTVELAIRYPEYATNSEARLPAVDDCPEEVENERMLGNDLPHGLASGVTAEAGCDRRSNEAKPEIIAVIDDVEEHQVRKMRDEFDRIDVGAGRHLAIAPLPLPIANEVMKRGHLDSVNELEVGKRSGLCRT